MAMTTAPNYLDTLPAEDKEALTASLRAWEADGVANPMIPLDGDVDGDGLADAFALDAAGELTIIPAVPITDTVSLSVGGGIETDGQDSEDG